MTRVALILIWAAMLWFGVGCSPVPEGRQVDVHKAVVKVLKLYGDAEPKWLPKVFVVPDAGCFGRGNVGFWDGDTCVSGVMFPGVSIYVVEMPSWTTRINARTLAHELAHWVGRDHPVGITFDPDSDDGRLVAAGRALLDSLPDSEMSTKGTP